MFDFNKEIFRLQLNALGKKQIIYINYVNELLMITETRVL